MFVYGGTLVPDGPEVPGTRAIAASDPTFDPDVFLEQACGTHRALHAAVAARQSPAAGGTVTAADQVRATADAGGPGDATGLLTGAAADEIDGFVGRDGWRSPVERHDHAVIIDASHDATDSITVRFGARVDGRDHVEDWVFERRAATGAYGGELGQESDGIDATRDATGALTCSSCGASLALEGGDACRFCGAALPGRPGPWRVAAIRPPRRVDPVAPPGPLAALGPDVPADELLCFARSVYPLVHRATATGSLADVRGVLTSGMRSHLERRPDDLAWDQELVELVDATIVEARRDVLDVVTIRFVAALRSGDIAEDWVFERPAPADAADAAPPTRCPVCGAAIALDEDGDCRYCSTHLRGVAGDWRLAAAYRPDTMATHPAVVALMQSRAGQRLVVLFLLAVAVSCVVAIVWLVTLV